MRKELIERSNNVCELCGSDSGLDEFTVSPKSGDAINDIIAVCSTCAEQLNDESKVTPNHWRCLNDSMWSEVSAVKVVAYRMLNQLKGEGWPMDLLDMIYLDNEELEWAKEGIEDENAIKHVDSNGAVLNNGDSVVLIKDLDVKGANFTAKRGTAVRNIRLVHDNPEQIEGKVNGQGIVILTQYVKK